MDLVIYLRNSIVHPSRKTHRAVLEVEDIWNIISIGTRYIELVLLFILGYRGEYSNRLVEDVMVKWKLYLGTRFLYLF
ncbi:hypothetical protein [Clostridioides difficile]|uniref:hypothetical protein n=1 Tax=Clostridioides difficile TaxID=1496 RepID=UPI0020B22E4D|nr:hypothetical protein [Clostridioides difficile]